MIPSPFKTENDHDSFWEEIDSLCDRYGFNHYLMVAGEPANESESTWTIQAKPIVSEGLLGAADAFIKAVCEKHGLDPTPPAEGIELD